MGQVVTITVQLGMAETAQEIKAGIDLLQKLKYLADPESDIAVVVDTSAAGNDENKSKAASDGNVSKAASPAPVVAIAPKPPATQPSTNTAVDLDSEGLPWDPRIHGEAKKKLAKGKTWKLIRNIDPELVTTVKAELKATMAAATVIDTTIDPTTPAAGDAAAAFGDGDELPETPMSFPALMNLITAKMKVGELEQGTVDAAVADQGLTSLPMLASRPDLVPMVAQKLALA